MLRVLRDILSNVALSLPAGGPLLIFCPQEAVIAMGTIPMLLFLSAATVRLR